MTSVATLTVAILGLGTLCGLVLHLVNQRRGSRSLKSFRGRIPSAGNLRVEKEASARACGRDTNALWNDPQRTPPPTNSIIPSSTLDHLTNRLPSTRIDPRHHLAPGTRLHAFLGWTVMMMVWLAGAAYLAFATLVPTYGLGLIGWIILGVFYLWHLRKVRARLRGSSVRVDATQFPEIHHAAESMAARLGLSECPEVYLVEGNILNAAAIKQGGQRSVVLIDDIVHGALATGNPNVLNFIIGHELAHHALGHTGFFRSKVSSRYLPLSRLDEFSCDAVAHALVADAAAARDAIILLLIGPQLFHRLDRVAFEEQVTAVVADPYSKKSESGLSHPLLLRRYARLREASRS